MFLRDGYAATSLEKVAEEAGFSKGAVYSNFDGKDALCLAVLDTLHRDVADAVLGSFEGARSTRRSRPSTCGPRPGSATPTGRRSRRSSRPGAGGTPSCARPWRSATCASADDRRRAAANLRAARAGACRWRSRTGHALLSLGIGLGVQRALNPELRVQVLSDVIRVMAGLPVPPALTHRDDPPAPRASRLGTYVPQDGNEATGRAVAGRIMLEPRHRCGPPTVELQRLRALRDSVRPSQRTTRFRAGPMGRLEVCFAGGRGPFTVSNVAFDGTVRNRSMGRSHAGRSEPEGNVA